MPDSSVTTIREERIVTFALEAGARILLLSWEDVDYTKAMSLQARSFKTWIRLCDGEICFCSQYLDSLGFKSSRSDQMSFSSYILFAWSIADL